MQIDKPITSALLIFLVVVLSFFFVVPKYKEFKAHQLILGEKEAEYNAKYNYYAQVSEVYEELQSRTENLKKIEDALPANSALGDLVYFFSQKSFENGLVAKDLYLMKISAINPESDIKEITFSMDLIGSYAAFKNFLYGLEKSARLFDVNAFSFSAANASSISKITTSSTKAKTTGKVTTIPISNQQTYPFRLEVKTHSY